MLDSVATEKAERELDRFLESQSKKRKGEDKANLEAAAEREADARKLAAMREENRVAWCEHLRHLAAVSLATAREYRRRARALEVGE